MGRRVDLQPLIGQRQRGVECPPDPPVMHRLVDQCADTPAAARSRCPARLPLSTVET